MFKKFIASILVLPFLIVPLFCCCITQAQAAATGVEHCNVDQDEHGATNDHADHNSSHSCDCHSFSTAAENSTVVHAALLSFPNFFPTIDVVAIKSASYLKSSMNLAYLGPPIGAASAVPFYTLYHSLRI